MLNRRFSCQRHIKTVILALFFILSSFAGSGRVEGVSPSNRGQDVRDTKATSHELEYELFSFSTISAEQGQKYLIDANLGDVSHFPNSPTVLFTSSTTGNLQKAKLIKNLVDCKEEYAVRVIASKSKTTPLPSCEQIMNNIGSIAIGSFTNPPAADGHARTIVDTINNNVIIIAPSRMMERIVSTIEKLQNAKPDTLSRTGTPVIINSNKTEVFSQNNDSNNEPILASAVLTENVSKKKPQPVVTERKIGGNIYAASERITDSPVESLKVEQPAAIEGEPGGTIVTTQSAPQVKPTPTQSNILAANQVVNTLSVPNPEDEVVLTLSDQLTLIEFIGFVGPYLKMDFMYNAEDFANKNVTINPNGVLKGRIKIKDLYSYLDTVLKFKGFVMTRGSGAGNLVIIVPKENAPSIDPPIAQPGQAPVEAGDSVRVDFFQLKHISTTTAEELIKNMKLSIQINSIPETKTLIITEYTSRIPRIKALLDIIDKPGEPKKFIYRQLQYTMSQTLAPKIQALAQQLGTVSITISTAGPDGVAMPERPAKRDGESDTAYQNRLRSWEAEVRRINEASARPRTPAPSAPAAEPTASTVFLDSDERTNRILMIGLEEKLKEVENLIDALDVVQRDPRKLQIYKIQFLDAEEVMKKLVDLKIIPDKETSQGPSSNTRTSRSTIPNQPARITSESSPAPVTTESGKSAGESLVAIGEEPLVVLVASTNSLLVNATDEQHTRISAIIDLVDKARVEIPFRVFKLKNTNPVYIKEMLDQLIEETIETRNPDDKIQSSVVSKVSKQDERITVVADSNTSSLIVNANKKNQDWIESLIKELDKRKPQVLIDVTLVQISKDDAFDYDLNLLSSIPDLTETSGLTSAILPGISSGASNLVAPLTNPTSRREYVDFQSHGGSGTAFYGDKHINALLKLVEQKSYGRVMAKPKILVNDNQLGKIESKDVTYVEKTSSIPVTSGTGGTQTNLIQTAVDYAPYDAGVTLNITPHISESNLLRLDIQLIRKDFGTITGTRPPDTTDSTVETIVTVPDRSTIILGGLAKLNQSKGGAKIPLLGDIPILGALFRSTNNSDSQRNLYVFVKAEIIRPPDEDNATQVDLERISKTNREAFEKLQNEFQGYQSFPPVKPTPMEPANALDAN